MKAKLPENFLRQILNAECHDPHHFLGMHNEEGLIVVRVFNPQAIEVFVYNEKSGKDTKMEKVHNDGLFELIFKDERDFFTYKLKIRYESSTHITKDPYSFLPTITDYDLYLFNEGNHFEIHNKLGAHLLRIGDTSGVSFSVWAPNARSVSVVGDFNNWDRRRHQMRVLGSSGVWEIFIPDLVEGDIYKFSVKQSTGRIVEKTDPYGFYFEVRPKTASVVWNIDKYEWKDTEWINRRKTFQNNISKPISIYEVHLGSWKRKVEEENRFLTYREIAIELADYIKEMGFTHIELLPVEEHPLDASWGYQVTGYFAPTSRYGTPEDFMYFVDTMHQNGIGVILDWVPGHFPKDDHALSMFDGTGLYEHIDPRKGEHVDWGTKIFNYGRNEVRNFLISNALFWIEKYHLDGLRVDAVASMLYLDYSRKEGEWIPNQYGGRENIEAIDFLKRMNEIVYSRNPGVTTIAEESTAFGGVSHPVYLGGLGFEFKWNMGWMHDTLEYFSKDPVFRKYHQGTITFSMIYAYSENFILVFSHDEVVHGKGSLINKMPGDLWQKFANLRVLYTYMWTHPGKKLLFMGQEFGQWDEWSEAKSLDWHLLQYDSHKKLAALVKDLNRLYVAEKALYELDTKPNGFEWIDFYDSDNSVLSYIRRATDGDFLVVVLNFTPVPRHNYRVGVPLAGFYKEIFNSDSEVYGGSNVGNQGGKEAEKVPWHGRPFSINIVLPPLGGLIFKYLKKETKNV
ncbi:MAG: 1,4-alpha-glucan branching protein GlgB [Brevinematia bacterium]